MSPYETELAAEQRRIRDAQHALHVRAAHVDAALLRARQGEDEDVVRARLASKGIVILVRPVAGSAA